MRRVKRFLKNFLLIVGALTIIFGIYYLISGYVMYAEAKNSISLDEKVQEIRSDENYVKLEDIPKIYQDAVIATEDHRFYNHHGIDIIALGRAFLYDIGTLKFGQGGSTISQQLAKNIYFTQKKQIQRKVAEIFMARHIEKNLSKSEILELYINICYFGNGYYGLREASLGYYGKEPINLTPYEATLLAGVPNAPNVYAPSNNIERTKNRQLIILQSMVEYGYLNEEEMELILSGE